MKFPPLVNLKIRLNGRNDGARFPSRKEECNLGTLWNNFLFLFLKKNKFEE